MQKILCPLDFSPTSLHALQYAVEMANVMRGSVTILVSITKKIKDKALKDFGKDSNELNVKRYFEELTSREVYKILEENKGKGIVQCNSLVTLEPLTQAVNQTVKEDNIFLVVMGSNGHGSKGRGLLGSNTLSLIENAIVPVMCIPVDALYNGLAKIIYASDYFEEDKLIIQRIIALASFFKSSVKVVHITKKKTPEAQQEFANFRDEILSFIKYNKLEVIWQEFSGNAIDGLDEFMQEQSADLLGIMTRPRSLVERIFSKSLTEKISMVLDYPILVFNSTD